MNTVYDPKLKANLLMDDSQHVRYIEHSEEFWPSEAAAPVRVAQDYLSHIAKLINVPASQLEGVQQKVSFMEPAKQGVGYRLSEEKQLFDTTTVGFYQTFLNLPVWQAGLAVTIKHNPYRVIRAANTSQENFDAELPAGDAVNRFKTMFQRAEIHERHKEIGEARPEDEKNITDFLYSLVDKAALKAQGGMDPERHTGPCTPRLIRGRFFVYKYDSAARVAVPKGTPPEKGPTGPILRADVPQYEPALTLPLPPVNAKIKDGHYYVVSEITFTMSGPDTDCLTWQALVEPETNSVLYLRALDGTVNGMVFLRDPITAGHPTATHDASNAVLNPLRTVPPVSLQDILFTTPRQELDGTNALLTNISPPPVPPPTEPAGTDFDFDVRTDDFAAVNAYFHVERFFELVESLGFPLATYFSGTTFPVRVDHRGSIGTANGIEVNAHCVGNGNGGIDHLCYGLADLMNTAQPLGLACDSRVHFHELGGHGILYHPVNSANFHFCHSAGDSLAVIFHDPESLAPDRGLNFPWVASYVGRRCDRNPALGWKWGGIFDDKGYGSEEILATTLFNAYRSIGGDAPDLSTRLFASRMMIYLILRAVGNLHPYTNPWHAEEFCSDLIAANLGDWTTAGISGGAYGKVLRWAFEKQGAFGGNPPAVDVYLDDGRHGEYPYEHYFWTNNSIWNRRAPDGLPGHQPPNHGAVNYAYARIKNRGSLAAQNIVVKAFHRRPGAGTTWPHDWTPMSTPQLTLSTLGPNNSEQKIVGPFQWTPTAHAGNEDCALMIVSCSGDQSNIANFTAGDSIADWRLVPNDNNIGMRNITFILALGNALAKSLHSVYFWVHNPLKKNSHAEIRIKLPELLVARGWKLGFQQAPENRFELESGMNREMIAEVTQGKPLELADFKTMRDRDIHVLTYMDDMLVGGMTYRLVPDLKEPGDLPPDIG